MNHSRALNHSRTFVILVVALGAPCSATAQNAYPQNASAQSAPAASTPSKVLVEHPS